MKLDFIRQAILQIATHPLTRSNRIPAVMRWMKWQISSRLAPGPILIPLTSNALLAASPSMHGATSHLYTGLGEFPEMGFRLHILRPGDLFLDVGAHVGAYSFLASGAIGSPISLGVERRRKDVIPFRVINCNI